MPKRCLGLLGLLFVLALAGCASERRPSTRAAGQPDDIHVPPFARWPYQRFSREAAVQIAMREWRAFGQPVVVKHGELAGDPASGNERTEGLWQRIGEYWWLGLPFGASEQGFTGKHNQNGTVFSAGQDTGYAWSAAFVAYVMRMAGAGQRFPYSATHADYINAARQRGTADRSPLAIAAERPESYAPQRGDLICMWRGRRPIRYDELPTGRFAGHCDIVVALRPGLIDAIGGNVDDSVAMKRVPTTTDGRIADSDGRALDPDHPWFVVVRVAYDIN